MVLRLFVELLGDSADLKEEIDRTEDELEDLGDKGERVGRRIAAVGLAIGRTLREAGKSMRRVGRDISAKVTAPILALGAGIFKVGSDFDATLGKIVGLVGVAREEVDGWRGDIARLAAETGKSQTELAEALFFVTSAGARGAEAIDILRNSAKAAAAGLGETEVVADALTSAVNAYGSEALNAERATGILVATVREGKAAADSIAGSLGPILPLAAELGVGFDQVGASIAAMTRLGLGAEEAGTSLRAVLSGLLSPSKGATDTLAEFGLSAQGLRKQLKDEGLIAVLTTLRETFGDNEEALAQVFPNIRALVGVLNLVGSSADTTRGIFERLAQETGSSLTKAFEATGGPQREFQRATAQLQTTLIELGNVAIPLIIPLLQTVTGAIADATGWFASLDGETQQYIVTAAAIAAAIGPVIIGLGFLATAIGALVPVITVVGTVIVGLIAATGPIGLMIAAVVAAIAIWKNWDQIGPIVQAMFEAVKMWLQDRLGEVLEFVGRKVQKVIGFFKDMFDKVVGNSFVPDMVDGIAREFSRLVDVMVQPTEDATQRTMRAFADASDAAKASASEIDAIEDSSGRASTALNRLASNLQGILSGLGIGGGDDFFGPILGITDLFSGALGAARGGNLGEFVGGLSGFRDGGSVVVGGSGGPDSQIFSAKVTPGERIDFTPPGRTSAAASGLRIVVNNSVADVARVTARQTESGAAIDVGLLDDAVGASLARGSGDRALGARIGARRVVRQRG